MVARTSPLDCGFDNEPKLSTSPARAHWTLNLLAPLVALLGPFFLASGTFGASGRFLLPMIHYPRGSRPSSIDSPRNGAYWHYADLRARSARTRPFFL